ncbi:MAG: luciferase-like protein [Candidatus Tectimicrobiota bacterium]|nr:MAG: luciferase-like protein [Candidatus Tectomicrobia bacterium]
MALGVRLRDAHLSLAAMQELTQLAEDKGYDSVWLPESMGREAITELTVLALSSRRIRVGTGIVPVFARLPTVAAAAIATAAQVAPGRVILGLGIGHQHALESGHGVAFSRPLQHVREFTAIARRVLCEGEVTFAGEIYRIARYRLDVLPPQPVPIFVAALRPQMLRLAGAIADGVLLNWVPLAYLPQAVQHIREGAAAAGRSPAEIQVAGYLRTCVTDTPEAVEQATRVQLARYGSMVYYQRYFASIGFADEAAAMAQAWQRGDADAAARAVTRSMIQALTVYGPAEACRERLQAYREAGLQLPVIAPFPVGEPIQETFRRTMVGCALSGGIQGSGLES